MERNSIIIYREGKQRIENTYIYEETEFLEIVL